MIVGVLWLAWLVLSEAGQELSACSGDSEGGVLQCGVFAQHGP